MASGFSSAKQLNRIFKDPINSCLRAATFSASDYPETCPLTH